MEIKTGIVGILLFCAGFAQAQILPKNHLDRQDNLFSLDANMTEAEFGAVIDDVASQYSDVVKDHGAKLVPIKKWTDKTVNAYASKAGKNWRVEMFGGLARRPEITKDGFYLVMCHELGHHLGGYFFYEDNDDMAAEGQSDYFAVHACLRKVWKNAKDENAKFRNDKLDATVKKACNDAWKTEAEQNLCYRIAYSGKSVTDLFDALDKEDGATHAPSEFSKNDPKKVTKTNEEHPASQCRLDTYVSGALCSKKFEDSIIPGVDVKAGQNSADAEKESSKYTCMESTDDKMGLRPRCWFKPLL